MERQYPARPIVAVGALVIRDGRVLLARRGKEPSYGKWSLPGGAVEAGEPLRAAVAREIREECGLVIDVTDTVEVFERLVPDGTGRAQYHYVIIDYVARWAGGEIALSDEVLEARWVHPDDLDRYDMTTGTIEVIRRLLRRAGTAG